MVARERCTKSKKKAIDDPKKKEIKGHKEEKIKKRTDFLTATMLRTRRGGRNGQVLCAGICKKLSVKVEQADESTLTGVIQFPFPALIKMTFAPKDLVWAKVKGYPWWPGQILPEGLIPPALLTRVRPADAWPILFFGTHD
jgi:hypothetical protein